MVVNLCRNGKYKTIKIHRLVAEAFIPNQEGKPQVDHINENKADNCVNNLRWATGSENVRHSFKHREKYYSPVLCVETGQVFPTMIAAAAFAGIHR